MPHIVSTCLDNLDFFETDLGSLATHGANLTVSGFLRGLLADERVDALEVLIPPALMIDKPSLVKAAQALPPERQGRGVLRFVPIHSVRETWADGEARILFCTDPELMPRTRYLRDKFAAGPMPIASMTHALGHHRMWGPLQRLAVAPPVAFDSIVSISRASGETLRKIFGFLAPGEEPPCRIDFIPHGIDASRFHPASADERRAARAALGLPDDGQIALYFGRLTPYNKADILPLVPAFARASQRADDLLVIAGSENSDGYVDRLQLVAQQEGVGDRVVVRTNIPPEDKALYYAAADLFVFPSDCIQESQGTTLLEAMASGLPVIASDWDGLPDMVREGETGLLVPTYLMPPPERVMDLSPLTPIITEYLLTSQMVWVDTSVLEGCLRRLLENPEERERMGRAARRLVEESYTELELRGRWLDLWDELAREAATESPAETERRRNAAERLGLPTPYAGLFHHYASHVFHPDRSAFRLSESGRAMWTGKASLQFFDETLPLLRPGGVEAIVAALGSAGTGWTKLRDLMAAVAGTDMMEDDVRFHVALLLKRGALETTEAP